MLCVSGLNGLLSVVAMLFFWRAFFKSKPTNNWSWALGDVKWALDCMVKAAKVV